MDEDVKVKLREEHNALTKLILAIEALHATPEWKAVKELLIDGLVDKIDKRLLEASLAPEISLKDVYTLQGERKWAKKYADLKAYASTLKLKLETVNKRIK